jgi:chromate transport protein ChrA
MNKRLIFRLLGYVFCTVPPLLAVLEHFPLWAREGSRPMLSGIALFLLIITAIPLRRSIARLFRRFFASPSAVGIWFFLFLAASWLAGVAATVADIALVGTLSSVIGTVFFRLGRREAGHEP